MSYKDFFRVKGLGCRYRRREGSPPPRRAKLDRGELLPQSSKSQEMARSSAQEAKGKLLPQDAGTLDTESETEEEPAASSSQGAETPWQRRVKLRASPDNKLATKQVAILHGYATIRGIPRDVLGSLPKLL